MILQRFEDLLDVHGADVGCWPEPERAAAAALLAESAAARAAHSAAARLDAALSAALPAGAGLRAAVLAIPRQHPRRAPRPVGLGWFAPGLVALAASAAIGFFLGAADLPGAYDQDDQAVDVAALIFGPGDSIGGVQ